MKKELFIIVFLIFFISCNGQERISSFENGRYIIEFPDKTDFYISQENSKLDVEFKSKSNSGFLHLQISPFSSSEISETWSTIGFRPRMEGSYIIISKEIKTNPSPRIIYSSISYFSNGQAQFHKIIEVNRDDLSFFINYFEDVSYEIDWRDLLNHADYLNDITVNLK